MQRLTMVVARSRNHVIGRDGKLPWHLSEDLRHFREVTQGHAVIMGRRTFESIGQPLPKRRNIVLSRQSMSLAGCEVASSLAEAIALARTTDPDPRVIGGATLYEQALPLATCILLTEVYMDVEGDTYFPRLDPDEWTEQAREERAGFAFVELRRKAEGASR